MCTTVGRAASEVVALTVGLCSSSQDDVGTCSPLASFLIFRKSKMVVQCHEKALGARKKMTTSNSHVGPF